MAQGDGDGVGGIVGFWHLGKAQNPLGHIHHLMLGGITVAHHRLLDLHRLVLGNLQACLADRQQNHTPALGNTDASGDILTEEQLFDGHLVGLRHFQKLGHIIINNFQPGGEIHTCRGGDGAASQKLKLIPLGFNQTKACDTIAGVDSQYPHCATSFFCYDSIFTPV